MKLKSSFLNNVCEAAVLVSNSNLLYSFTVNRGYEFLLEANLVYDKTFALGVLCHKDREIALYFVEGTYL